MSEPTPMGVEYLAPISGASKVTGLILSFPPCKTEKATIDLARA